MWWKIHFIGVCSLLIFLSAAPSYSVSQLAAVFSKNNLEKEWERVEGLTRQGKRQEALLSLQGLLRLLEVSQKKQEKGFRLSRQLVVKKIRLLARVFLHQESFQQFQEGLNLLRSENKKAAQVKLNQVLEKEVDHLDVLVRLAQAEFVLGEKESALARLQKSLQLVEGDLFLQAEVVFWLARVLVETPNKDKGLQTRVFSLLEVCSKEYPTQLENRYLEIQLKLQFFEHTPVLISQSIKQLKSLLGLSASFVPLSEFSIGSPKTQKAFEEEVKNTLSFLQKSLPS